MPKNFWLMFALQEAVTLAEMAVQSSSTPPKRKADLEKVIADTQVVLADIQAGV